MKSELIHTEQSSVRLGTRLQNQKDWKTLFDGDVDAILLKGFAQKKECAQLVSFIKKHPNAVRYKTAAGIIRLGSSFNDIRKAGNIAEEYAKSDILEEVSSINPVLSKMIGHIAASWPHGVETYCYQGIALHRSIARRIINGGAEPHDDNIAKELPQDQMATTVQAQLGINLYIEIPKTGGELEGWHLRLTQEEYNTLRNEDSKLSYGIKRDKIGPPNWVIKPTIGDMIIFQNSEVHAIRLAKGARTTWSFFLGYRGDNKPLLIWS